MCSLGGGFQKSSSQSNASSSGPLGPAGEGRREQGLDAFANYLFGRHGSTDTGLLAELAGRAKQPLNYVTPTLTATGLLPEQEAGLRQPFEQAVTQAMNRASGNFANRGFLRPENIQAIAGSAAQNVAPAFAPLYADLAAQNVAQRTQAPLVLEDVTRRRIADFLQALGINVEALGGTSRSSGGSNSFGLQGEVSTTPKGTPQPPAQSCWIAAVFYGDGSPTQILIRSWLAWKAKQSRRYRLFAWFYTRYGQRIAATLDRQSMWRWGWYRLFEKFRREALRDVQVTHG